MLTQQQVQAPHSSYLIAGLKKSKSNSFRNRHNIGFRILGTVCLSYYKPGFLKLYSKHTNTIYLKPQTYMNRSEVSLDCSSIFFRIPNSNILLIYDDINLDFGSVDVRFNGGSAGHNRLKNIESAFFRIRVEIKDTLNKYPIKNFALSNFSILEEKQLPMIYKYTKCVIDAFSKNLIL
ncbi:MAG: aminoacyl-tRNA hydrolase [Deltaproteobacteria bacterium]|nr:MAG: aminoacyl-tRNA hydrolase [Deltaproteobacteria bacterium]